MATAEDIDGAGTADERWSATEMSLWLARKGRWQEAHDLCQTIPGKPGAWIHAWLHREEGDYWNACYWYDKAGVEATEEEASLDDEWWEIARELLEG